MSMAATIQRIDGRKGWSKAGYRKILQEVTPTVHRRNKLR